MKNLALAGIVAAVSGTAMAASTEVQFDFQGMDIQATDGMGNNTAFGGVSHTGALRVEGSTALGASLDITEDRGAVPSAEVGMGTATDFTFDMTVLLSNGAVTGGSLLISIGADTYTADIVSGIGSVRQSAGQTPRFEVDGLTFAGAFSGTTFAGIDVSRFVAPLGGSFVNFEYRPNGAGFDGQADTEVFVVIPLPTTVGLAGAGLLGVAGIRRRRSV